MMSAWTGETKTWIWKKEFNISSLACVAACVRNRKWNMLLSSHWHTDCSLHDIVYLAFECLKTKVVTEFELIIAIYAYVQYLLLILSDFLCPLTWPNSRFLTVLMQQQNLFIPKLADCSCTCIRTRLTGQILVEYNNVVNYVVAIMNDMSVIKTNAAMHVLIIIL